MIEKKEKAIRQFASELKERMSDKLAGIFLYGSNAKGIASEGSDIDLLVVYKDMNEFEVLETASEISFKIACEEDELIEVVAMSIEEYRTLLGNSPFLWEVVQFGKPIFITFSATEWQLDFKDYLELAKEYIGYAEDSLKEGKLRLTIDTAYNACELLVKALILSKRESLATSHGGIVGQFGRLFVMSGELPEQFGKNLHLSLDLRAKARYKPKALIQKKDAECVLNFAKALLDTAQMRF